MGFIYDAEYISVDTEVCRVSSTTFGNIPSITVSTSRGNSTINSRRERSVVYFRYLLHEPNAIRLYSQIEYLAPITIPVEPSTAAIGLLWKAPRSAIISPTQFADSGTAALNIVKIKKNVEKIGIYSVTPR